MRLSFQKVDWEALDQSLLMELVALSKDWADEDTCPSYLPNEVADFQHREVYLVRHHDRTVAYAVGDIKMAEKGTPYIDQCDCMFELDELYVTPDFRSAGVGQALFQYIEADLENRVRVIKTVATSYRYLDLLRFYIDELGMTFNHAVLTKSIGTRPGQLIGYADGLTQIKVKQTSTNHSEKSR